MKFSGKMCFKILLEFTKNQDFTLSLKDTIFEQPQGAGGVKLTPLPTVLDLILQAFNHWFNFFKC